MEEATKVTKAPKSGRLQDMYPGKERFVMGWEVLKDFPDKSMWDHHELHVTGSPIVPVLLEELKRVLITYGEGAVIDRLANSPTHYSCKGLRVSATFQNGNSCRVFGNIIPSDEQVIKVGVKDSSYNTQNYGMIESFEGVAITSTPDGREFLSIGTRPSGDAWGIHSLGGIEHRPIVRREKLQLVSAGRWEWIKGEELLLVKKDQFGNRYAFYEGNQKPCFYLPYWEEDWYSTENVRGTTYKYGNYLRCSNCLLFGEKTYVFIPREMLTGGEVLLTKYTEKGAKPLVEVLP